MEVKAATDAATERQEGAELVEASACGARLTRKNNQKNGLSNNQNTHFPLSNTTYQYHSKTIKKNPNTGMIPVN